MTEPTPSKQAIIHALRAFIEQRPGIDARNYGSWQSYRQEARGVTRDLEHARTLLRAVEWRDSITAADLLAACKDAFSGRVTIRTAGEACGVSYCTGQYFPTEYRKAVAAVCASALWNHVADHCMPQPSAWEVVDYTDFPPRRVGEYPTESGARAAASSGYPLSAHALYDGLSAGDWLRRYFRREFGRAIAGRYFR